MQSETEILTYINKLADKVASVIDSSNVIEAFRTIPRHLFFQNGFYILDKQAHRVKFLTPKNTEISDWLEIIYDNQILMLSRYENDSLSSSSEPALMAQMLAALKIRSGMHILEIGTGSGYNAALLAHLVGNTGKVTTIDVDPELTKNSQKAINTIMTDIVSIHTGNGLLGVPQEAPYDRIIATASHHRVPEAWVEQLQDGGLLLMSFEQSGGLMLLEKQGMSVSGHFLKQRGYFTPIVELYDLSEIVIEVANFNSLLSDDFRFFAGWIIPGIAVLPIGLSSDKTMLSERGVRFRSQNGEESVIAQTIDEQVKLTKQCSEEFVQSILDAIQKWDAFEQPDSSRFHFTIDSNHQQIINVDHEKLVVVKR